MRSRMLNAACLGFATLAACAPADRTDPEADRTAIRDLTMATEAAENAGDAEQMRGHFAPDLVLMIPNMPAIVGADSVAAVVREFFDLFDVQIAYASEEVVVDGDLGFDRGTYRETLTPKAGGPAMTGTYHYLFVYRRQADGTWKHSHVIFNSADPLPDSGTP